MATATQLAPEDELRINVLLANEVFAIRIDEAANTLYALTANGEAKLKLHPNTRPERYFRQLRETLSSHVLGSPGGYPIYLRRWTRMGDIKSSNLKGLLLLGEPEAVVAVVRSPNLTEEVASYAWWAMPNSENARRMLEKSEIAESKLATSLADFLVEFLPFEEDPADMIDSVRLVLKPGLINDATRDKLWKMGARKTAIRVGFMAGAADALPEQSPHHGFAKLDEGQRQSLNDLRTKGNPLAELLIRLISDSGQAFVATAELVFKKPATQEVVSKLMNVIGDYFAPALCGASCRALRDIDEIGRLSEQRLAEDAACELLDRLPGFRPHALACLNLAEINDAIVTPIFATSSAVGSVMRKQIAPVTDPLLAHLSTLRRL